MLQGPCSCHFSSAAVPSNSGLVRRSCLCVLSYRATPGRPLRSLPPHSGVGFQQLVVPEANSASWQELTSSARYNQNGSTTADGNGASPDTHTLYAFPFTLQQLMLYRALCVAGNLEQAAQALEVSTNHLQMVLGRLERELNIGLVSQKVSYRKLPLVIRPRQSPDRLDSSFVPWTQIPSLPKPGLLFTLLLISRFWALQDRHRSTILAS